MNTAILNWKTSILGLIAGAITLYTQGMGWKQALLAAALAAFGLAAKDGTVTGVAGK